MKYLRRFMVPLTFALLVASLPAWGQTNTSICDKIAKMEPPEYRSSSPFLKVGRWQEEPAAPVERQILRLRKKAIPLLIGCLTDERETKMPVWDLWPRTSVGHIALYMLCDLFSNETQENYTLKGVITWEDLLSEAPPQYPFPALVGWDGHLEKYGRQSIQRSWQKAWTENKDRIYWDDAARCFRVKGTP